MGRITGPLTGSPRPAPTRTPTRADLAVIAHEPVWPAHSGGRARMAGLAVALAAHLRVVTIEPGLDAPTEHSGVVRLPWTVRRGSRVREIVSSRPRLGYAALGDDPSAVLDLVDHGTPLFVMNSYLAPWLSRPDRRVVVDFPNLEVDRQRSMSSAGRGWSMHRVVSTAEALKAARWEPLVARRAGLALAVDAGSAARLASWGARTLVVPNSVTEVAVTPSPLDGPVVALANAGYQPNLDGLRWLVREVWPRVRRARVGAELVIAGRGTADAGLAAPGVRVLGEVVDAGALLRSAAVVLAPVASGGGTQLKVLDALSHGRLLVATPYSAQSVPRDLRAAALVAADAQAFAAAVDALLSDPPARHRREHDVFAGDARVPTWDVVVRPLIDELARWRAEAVR